jgi:hypothetical protein
VNESERLAQQLELALNGGAWHGPSWKELLEGVTVEEALGRPIPDAHSIAEIVLHETTWHDVVRRRLEGESPQVSDLEDWPAAETSEAWWAGTADRLFATGKALCETVRNFPPDKLHTARPGLEDTWFGLVNGELQHVLYHAGQVAVLRKARTTARV